MTSIQHHVVTQSHSTSQLDNHLDALLDDLQTSVSRPGALTGHSGPLMNGSAFGGQVSLPPGATGYREVTTTVTRENNGVPVTSRDYQIEYLNPANSVTVLDERSSSPALDMLKNPDLSGHQLKSYKTEMYDYKYSKTTTDRKTTGYATPHLGGSDAKAITMETKSYHDPHPQDARTDTKGETNVSKNLNELDMLLKELNTSPPNSGDSSKREHVQTIEVERTPGRYDSTPKRSASATRETYSETRTNRAQSPAVAPGTPKAPARTINVQREYNTMESRSHTSRRDSPGTPTLRRRTPSPSSGDFRPSNFSNYPISPKDLTPTRTVTSKSYSYSTAGRRTPTPTAFADEPQPYRSPSPVSFPQKRSPSPVRKTLGRSDSNRSASHQLSQEAPTVITYKYSSHSREQSRYPGHDARDHDDSTARPFPTSTPLPAGEQSPPKKLDELMASFQDSKARTNEYSNEYRHNVEYAREAHDRQGDLQRSPSFERNLKPSNVRMTQSYATQQQQNQEYQYQHREQYQNQYQQREQPGVYREYQRKEEYQTRERPNQLQQREQYQQQQYQQYHQNQYQQERREQHHQNQTGFQQERRDHHQQNHAGYQQEHHQNHYQYQQHSQTPVSESVGASQAYRATSASRSVAGPPVYYPPGVELFTKKEEALLMQEQSAGKDKSKAKSKSDKGKEKGKKLSGVPVCLPVCCAMPCSIM